MDDIFLTQEGYDKLTERLNYLKTVKRQEVSEKIKLAREFGDISENAEYEAAKDEQGMVEGEILEIEVKLRTAKIIADVIDTSIVSIGSKVSVENLTKHTKCKYEIVGTTEADPFKFRISNESPIGKALIGAKKGAKVEVELPNKSTIILKVEKIES